MANDLRVKLSADISSWSANMRKASKDVEDTVKTIKVQFGGLQNLGSQFQNIGFAGLAGLTAPIVAAGVAITKVRGDIDALERGLVSITGSAEEASQQFARLREVAKLPGLGLEEAVRASINLQSIGLSASEAERDLKAFGNALALVGRGKADLEEVVRQLGQLSARGKVTADNLKPILERVPQVASIMRKEFGTVDTEVLQKMGVSSQKFIDVLVNGLEKLPAATGGVRNEVENLQDTLKLALNDLGKQIEPVISGFLRLGASAVGSLSDMAERFSNASPATRAFTLTLVGLTGIVPAVIVGLGSLANAAIAIKTAMAAAGIALGGPVGIITGLISLVAIGGAAVYAAGELGSAFNEAELAAKGLSGSVDELKQSLRTILGVSPEEAKKGIEGLVEAMGGEGQLLVEIEDKTGRVIKARVGATSAVVAQTKAHADLAGKLQEVVALEVELSEAIGAIQRRGAAAEISAMADAMVYAADVARELPAAVAAVEQFGAALSRAGVSGDEAAAAFRRFEAGLAFIAKVKRGEYRISTEDLIAVDYSKLQLPQIDTGDDILNLPADNAARAAAEIDRLRKIYGKGTAGIASDTKRAFQEVSTVFNDLGRDLAKLILDGGKFKDVMITAARQMGEALLRLVLQQALQPIMKSVTDLLGAIPGLSKIFGGGATAAAGSAAGSIAGSVGGSVAGAGGSAAGAVASATVSAVVGAVAGVVGAVSGVIGNFQMAGMNKSLDLIEKETRYSQIHLLNILEKLNAHIPGIDGIHLRLQELRTFGIGVWPQPGYNWAGGGGVLTVNNNIGMMYGGPAGLDEFMNALVGRMRLAGVLPK